MTQDWDRTDSGVAWTVRLTEPARFRIALDYATASAENTGAFEITFGDQRLTGRVAPTSDASTFSTQPAGEVRLAPGEYTVTVRPTAIAGEELMRLRHIEFTPLTRPQ